jgi:hypothetical protein
VVLRNENDIAHPFYGVSSPAQSGQQIVYTYSRFQIASTPVKGEWGVENGEKQWLNPVKIAVADRSVYLTSTLQELRMIGFTFTSRLHKSNDRMVWHE